MILALVIPNYQTDHSDDDDEVGAGSAQLLKLKSSKCLVFLTSDDNNHICS